MTWLCYAPKVARLLILAAALSPLSAAAQLTSLDTGTYQVLDQQLKPIEMYYRLSLNAGKWMMEGRTPGKGWENISCDAGCEYRDSIAADVASYFPMEWTARLNITCIQNIAQAFCKGVERGNPARGMHIVVALVTGKPILIFLRPSPGS